MKTLIAYFSRKGNNYVNGNIVNLSVGNTEAAQLELRSGARPELVGQPANADQCDTVYLGFPNWWGTMPMGVFAFLEGYDFSGKTIRTFCTHEGSGMGRSESDIREVCPGATVLAGLAIHGGSVGRAERDIENWVQR